MSARALLDPPIVRAAGERYVVAGFDDHAASRSALTTASTLAVQLDASLVVVHVLDFDDYPADPDAADWDASAERQVAAERETAEQLLASAREPWSYHLAQGDPAFALAAAARELDAVFIVVGASGRGIPQRLLHGSVPQSLFRHQAKPVLVVPAPHS